MRTYFTGALTQFQATSDTPDVQLSFEISLFLRDVQDSRIGIVFYRIKSRRCLASHGGL